jgi:glycosyltransferase involved in cell wall biosynthesis
VLTFDLVVATLGRTHELDALLDSLENQSHRAFRVLVVDQNKDGRAAATLARHPEISVLRLESEPGLSRARNVALAQVSADVVGFPDDDCSYPADLLERIAARLSERLDLDGVTGRATDAQGNGSERWPTVRCPVTVATVWNRVNSHTLFLRRGAVERAGRFDESLGLGSGRRWHSGEETDFVVGALRAGARIEYDPSFVIVHPQPRRSPSELRALGARDGASVGFILRKHRYPIRTVCRMLIRPLGGVSRSLVRGDLTGARFHLATLAGRIRGYWSS